MSRSPTCGIGIGVVVGGTVEDLHAKSALLDLVLLAGEPGLDHITQKSGVAPAVTKLRAGVHVVQADADDGAILECAAAARSDFLVTGDKHLL
jgi:hypothetical protein